MSSTSSASTTATAAPVTRRNKIALRVGLVLAGILALLQIQTGVGLFRAEGFSASSALLVVVPLVALAAIVFAWRGSFQARLVVIVASLIPALSALPAYFVPDLPASAVIAASLGIFWALVVTVLLLVPPRRNH